MRNFLIFVVGIIVGIMATLMGIYDSFKITKNVPEQKPPVAEVPTTPVGKKCYGQSLKVEAPVEATKVAFPLTIKAVVDNRENHCNWTMFEWQAGTVTLKTAGNVTLGTAVLTTTDDWMQAGPVNFTATLTVATPPSSPQALTLVFDAENPSGEPGNAQQKIVPVIY